MVEIFEETRLEEEDTQRGRYLTFTLDENVYGLPIVYVKEIIGMQPITRVPETPDFIRGIVNLRGKIVPLIDVRLKFGKPEIPYGDRTCIIVVQAAGVLVGLIVDRVDDVTTIEDENIAAVPENSLGCENKYIEGIGKTSHDVVLILNAERLLKHDEREMLEQMGHE